MEHQAKNLVEKTMDYLHDYFPNATYFDAPYTGHSGANASGYGPKIRTSYMVRINNRNHRLYCMCWSNSGTLWVKVKGNKYIFHEHCHKKLA